MNSNSEVVMLSTYDILPNRFQPRIKFKEGKINELAESIKKYGVIQPIIVRKIADKYEIIAGERRYKATLQAGLSVIPAIVNNLNDADSSEIALIENVQRENLTPIEESVSYKRIIDMSGMTQESLATRLGISQSAVANKLRLLQLTDEVQEALLENKISERHARSLLRVTDDVMQKEMLIKIINERLTVRKLDEEIKKVLLKPKPENIEEEIEVLDLFESIVNEKGNITMNNNDPINQFDLPETNIINDVPVASEVVVMQPAVEQEQPVLAPTPVQMNVIPETPVVKEQVNQLNPGFMDIDKIEREATDIIQTVPTPVAPDLLKPTEIEQSTPIIQPPVGGGRFFDNIGEGDSDASDSAGTQAGAFNFNFETVPVATPEVAPPEVIVPVQEGIEGFSNIVNNIPEESVATNPQPLESSFGTDIGSLVTEETVQFEPISSTPELMSPVENIVTDVAPVIEPAVVPIQEPIAQPISEPVQEITSELTQEPIVQSITPQSIEAPVQEPIVEPIQEKVATPFSADNVGAGSDIMPSMVQTNQAVGNIASLTPQPEVEIQNPISFNTREGIDKIRNIVKELESSGFRITSEEADSANSYEIKIVFEK